MRAVAIVLGLVFVAIAVAYWVLPAGSLPGFFPGFEANSTQIHLKHGIAQPALILAALCFCLLPAQSVSTDTPEPSKYIGPGSCAAAGVPTPRNRSPTISSD